MSLRNDRKKFKSIRFVGVSLCGGKTNKSALACIEYFPDQKKIFLSHLESQISNSSLSGDEKIHKFVSEKPYPSESVAFDVPLNLPKCLRCKLKCPGYETCEVDEVKWLRKHYSEWNKKKRPRRSFTPYTERCAEFFLAHYLEEKFLTSHALGANLAPLTARALFIKRRLKTQTIEVNTSISLWRLGRSLGIQKSYLRQYKHSVEGVSIRKTLLDKLQDKNVAFLYAQDIKTMINNSQAFDAFLCALTGVLNFLGECEKRPKGYPKNEGWVSIPIQEVKANFNS